jgi:hypothetical protein
VGDPNSWARTSVILRSAACNVDDRGIVDGRGIVDSRDIFLPRDANVAAIRRARRGRAATDS